MLKPKRISGPLQDSPFRVPLLREAGTSLPLAPCPPSGVQPLFCCREKTVTRTRPEPKSRSLGSWMFLSTNLELLLLVFWSRPLLRSHLLRTRQAKDKVQTSAPYKVKHPDPSSIQTTGCQTRSPACRPFLIRPAMVHSRRQSHLTRHPFWLA